MFIQTQQTPNPNSLKFLTEKKVSLVGPIEFKDKSETSVSLIKNILSINGVTGIFLSDDYLSVNKDANSEWEDLKHIIISYINDFYDQGNECIISEKRSENSEELSSVKNTIIKILETKVRPAVGETSSGYASAQYLCERGGGGHVRVVPVQAHSARRISGGRRLGCRRIYV